MKIKQSAGFNRTPLKKKNLKKMCKFGDKLFFFSKQSSDR